MRFVRSLLVLGVISATVACGEWAPPLPTAPTDPSRGATISGTARSGSVASIQAPSSGLFAPLLAAVDLLTFAQPVAADNKITVTVAGTDVTATLTGSGNFVL